MSWCGCVIAGTPDPSTGGVVVLEAVAHAFGTLLHVAGGVRRLALGLVGLALGLGPAVAGHLARSFLDRTCYLVLGPSHHRSPAVEGYPRSTRGPSPGSNLDL